MTPTDDRYCKVTARFSQFAAVVAEGSPTESLAQGGTAVIHSHAPYTLNPLSGEVFLPSPIYCEIDSEGWLTHDGERFVMLVVDPNGSNYSIKVSARSSKDSTVRTFGPMPFSVVGGQEISLAEALPVVVEAGVPIVRGPRGETGPVGPQGETGETGPQGEVGPIGETGPIGPQGDLGPSHFQSAVDAGYTGTEYEYLMAYRGPQGLTGATGATGPQGDIGPQGEAGPVGPTGPQGERGLQGDRGLASTVPGPAGPRGSDGTSFKLVGHVPTAADLPASPNLDEGYLTDDTGMLHVFTIGGYVEVGVVRGPEGPTGPQGEVGDPGPAGVAGSQGPIGPAGATGPQGVRGSVGPAGIAGPEGPTGPVGPKGDRGSDGNTLKILGSVPTAADLPADAIVGDGWTTEDDGHLFMRGELGFVDVGLMRGPEGLRGLTGAKGDKGDKGDQGIPGIQGLTGPKGDKGDTGPAGPQGDPGVDGQNGTNVRIVGTVPSAAQLPATAWLGDSYVTGDTGEMYTFTDGGFINVGLVRGPQGLKGDQGIQGVPGIKGDTGAAGAVGPVGPKGADSIVPGPKGDTGAQGPVGPVELSVVKVVKHLADATVARPNYESVRWIGSVAPNNALAWDDWLNTTGA